MSHLPPDFQFSQGSLQDYVECRRRFQLHYLLRVAWPALESEPALENERAMQQGARFHRLAQQLLLGIPVEPLTALAQGDDLSRWWQNYLRFAPGLLQPARVAAYPEITLAAPLGGYRLIAKYDLIAIHPDQRAAIYDWKTSRRRPKRQWLLARLQTRVYPYLLAQAGAFLNQGRGFQAEQIEMIYWFAEAPNEPERIAYHTDQLQRDAQYLQALVAEIASLPEAAFTLTPHAERCRFCTYRSLCDRGVRAGDLSEADEAEATAPDRVDFDFEQIAEIEF
jgi:RecB family exonuclease